MIEAKIRDLLAEIASAPIDVHFDDVRVRVRRRRIQNGTLSVLLSVSLIGAGVAGASMLGHSRRARPVSSGCDAPPTKIETRDSLQITDVDVAGGTVWAIGSMFKSPEVRPISSPSGVEIRRGPENEPKNILLMRADDGSWDQPPAPPQGNGTELHFDVIAANDIWVTGGTSNNSANVEPLVQHWNGSTWTRVEVPHGLGSYELRAVDGVESNDVWFVGATFDRRTVVMHWDGTAIRRADAPSPDSSYVTLERVLAIARDDVWAVGWGDRPIALHWDGGRWSETKIPSAQTDAGIQAPWKTTLEGIAAAPNGDLVAVGHRQTGPRTSDVAVMRYHNEKWSQVDAPTMDNGGQALLVDIAVTSDGTIWIASRTTENGIVAATLAKSNGSTWSIERIPSVQMLSLIASQGNQVFAFGEAYHGSPHAPQIDTDVIVRCGAS